MAGSPTEAQTARWHAWVAVAATSLTIGPFLAAIVATAGRRVYPIGDTALIDLTVRDVFTTATPLLGAYSRFGWHHPGPSMYWLLAPFSLVTGGRPWGIIAGNALVQAGAIALCARLAWRRSGLFVTLTVLAVQTLGYVALRSDYPWWRPWNPFLAFPCLVLFLLVVWYIGLGDTALLPLAAFVGTVLVQAHVGYALLVALGIAWIAWFTVRHHLARQNPARWRRSVLWSSLVVGVLWLPPLVEQLRHGTEGNVALLIRSMLGRRLPGSPQFESTGYGSIGLEVASQLFGAEYRWPPPWLGGPALRGQYGFAVGASAAWLLVPAAFVISAFWYLRRRRSRSAVHALVLVSLSGLVGLVSLARLRGEITDYAFYWRTPISLLLVGVPVAVIVATSDAYRRPVVRTVLLILLCTTITVPSVLMTVRAARGDVAQRQLGDVVGQLVTQLRSRPGPEESVELRQTGDLGLFFGIPIGVFAELDRLGLPVRLSDSYADAYLDGRHHGPTAAPDRLWYVAAGMNVSRLAPLPGARVIAATSPLSTADERRLQSVQRSLDAQLAAAGREDLVGQLDSAYPTALTKLPGLDQGLVREAARLNAEVMRKGYRYSVVEFDRADAPPGVPAW